MTSTTTTKIRIDDGTGKPPLLVPFTKPAAAPISIKSVVLIYNPVGGRRKAQKLADEIVLPTLEEAGIKVTVHKTTHAGHEAEMGQSLDLSEVDAILAMGGDGTCSNLLSGFLTRTDKPTVAVGFLPAGTGNTYMREVLGEKVIGGCESGMRAALKAIIGGHTRRVDAFKCSMTATDGTTPLVRFALNTVMLGFGPDANAVAETRRWLGPARYSVSVKTEILKLPCRKKSPCTLTLDSNAPKEMDLFLIALQNNKHTGVKHRIAPEAQLDNGLVDVLYTPKPVRSILKAAALDAMVQSGGSHIHNAIVKYEKASTVAVDAPKPTRIMLDGDIVGYTPLKLEVLAQAFLLLTPEHPQPS
eukprot:CAMPEP_0174698936 /NCGR_PEP_ID=MMETSP1094-20130205/4377_1 /TAXON_ID=156173 /ORGANISM="Chrysochromulina brevifilum, Strain UTEX LB 985" /LENGTH=357 /DNA_ID=CAMNT_0015896183 /DNA_START=113 /DNA_END=1186 /DNA_ORIENTATION=-